MHVLLTPAPWAGQSESLLSVFVTFIAILAIFLYLSPKLKRVRFKTHFEIHFNQIWRLYVFRKVNKRTQRSLTPGPASCKPHHMSACCSQTCAPHLTLKVSLVYVYIIYRWCFYKIESMQGQAQEWNKMLSHSSPCPTVGKSIEISVFRKAHMQITKRRFVT